jgi:hypothetical protein
MCKFWLLLLLLLALAIAPDNALAHGAIACTGRDGGYRCSIVLNEPTADEAAHKAQALCEQTTLQNCSVKTQFYHECAAAVAGPKSIPIYSDHFPSRSDTEKLLDLCNSRDGNCHVIVSACEVVVAPTPTDFTFSFSQYRALAAGLLFGLGAVLVLLLYAKRAALANWLIHGNLPYVTTLPAEDIHVSFVRKQRVNWYGRVVFGFVAQIALTDHQLLLIRRYWLGRTIAFDSIRRERRNQLAKLHLMRAGQLTIPKFRKAYWVVAILLPVFVALYFLVRALISFLVGLLFIRVTIAKLVRGTLVESTNLTIILQAKEAIEVSADQLKEYLETAETFDGRQEVYEPK